MVADNAMKQNGFGKNINGQHKNQNNGEPSLLTEEEQEALKPKEVKVENPWIYEQTHQEYLENIKVS